MKIKGIIFDLDGTLVHTIEDIAGAANVMLRQNGLPEHDISYYLQWIGNGAFKFIERSLGTKVEEQQLRDYVAQFKEIYSQNLHDKSRIYPGIPDVLDRAVSVGMKLSVLSNKPHLLTRKVCEYYLSVWPFDPVFGQREEVPRKPDPAAALEIARVFGMQPGNILFVGDSANDILTARAAGMIPLGVSWGYGRLVTEPMEDAHPMVERPLEILDFMS